VGTRPWSDDGERRRPLISGVGATAVLVLVLLVAGIVVAGCGKADPDRSAPVFTVAPLAVDGRPTGHTGIWFDVEPVDPVERLVYESQRFIGEPVRLRPLGDRAVFSFWEDMPDPCHPEVMRRMEELGLWTVKGTEAGYREVSCVVGGIRTGGSAGSEGLLKWGIMESSLLPDMRAVRNGYGGSVLVSRSGGTDDAYRCVAGYETSDDSYVTASFENSTRPGSCAIAACLLQIVLNVEGPLW
jgi:hypothetical protein